VTRVISDYDPKKNRNPNIDLELKVTLLFSMLSMMEAIRQARAVRASPLVVDADSQPQHDVLVENIRQEIEEAIAESAAKGTFDTEGARLCVDCYSRCRTGNMPPNYVDIAQALFPSYKIADVSSDHDNYNMFISIKPSLFAKWFY
jgi:hypothetical protein